MSRARECFGAGGLSFLLDSWTGDLKMLAPFLFLGGALEGEEMKKCRFCLGEIPKEAKVCMHCGKEQKGNSISVGQVIGIIIFILFVMWLWNVMKPVSKAIVETIDEQVEFNKMSETQQKLYMLKKYGHYDHKVYEIK